MLTLKQKELLELLEDHQERGVLTPSFDEMKDALGLHSKSGIHRLITALEERGHIRRLPNRARALEVVRGASEKEKIVAYNPNITSIPLYGKIAAGRPIEAMQGSGEMLDVPSSMVHSGSHYALTVSGDSMVEAGILDGDTAIIRETKLAHNGAIVVALVEEQESTLKKFFKEGRSIRLEPANRDYQSQIYPSSRVQVQGQLVGLYRNY